ncbi:MAG: hypothetical protein ACUVXF_12315 [Desulfobaccales bacterium]
MAQDGRVELVRLLIREVIATARPEKIATFADDFAALVISGGLIQAEESLACPRPSSTALDTTLVAGMFFQVLREAENLPISTPERVSFIRRQAKSYLATRLAGQIPLSQFFRLLDLIEEHVQKYFDEMQSGWLGGRPQAAPPQVSQSAPEPEIIHTDALRRALQALPLLLKGRRKLTTEALEDFLRETGGRWFRLLDFEEHFAVNKKTAWAYLAHLLQAGILEHNGEKANRVRYILAELYRR